MSLAPTDLQSAALFTQSERRSISEQLPTPLYHQLFLLLRDKILTGSLLPGARLPGEFEIGELFGVSRITAKRALDELAAHGMAVRQRGRGTYVADSMQARPLQVPLDDLMVSLKQITGESTIRLLQFERLAPPADIRRKLALPRGSKVAFAKRVRLLRDEPFAYYQSWTNTESPDFSADALADESRLKVFASAGIVVTKVEQVLCATAADDELATALEVSVGDPLLTLERLSLTHGERPVDLLQIYYRPDRFQYRMTMGVSDHA